MIIATYTQGNATVTLSRQELTQEERKHIETHINSALHQYGKAEEGRKDEKKN